MSAIRGNLPLALVLAGLGGSCRSDERRVLSVSEPEQATPMDASPGFAGDPALEPETPLAAAPVGSDRGTAGAGFPADWCDRVSADALLRDCALLDIADEYFQVQYDSCETTKLTLGMSDDQAIDWSNYLTTYSYAMAGCDLLNPLPGGIGEFGLANTAVVGWARGPLGKDDAGHLIAQYLEVFAAKLALSDEERAVVEAYLWSTAQSQIVDGVSGTLSSCGEAGSSGS